MATLIEEVSNSLARIQNFDPRQLPREDDLGRQMSFQDAVAPATKLIRLYQQLSLSSLDDLPDDKLIQIKKRADVDYEKFKEILGFQASLNDAASRREQLIKNIQDAYLAAFNILHPLIAFSVSRSVNPQRLERQQEQTEQILAETRVQARRIAEELGRQQAQTEQIQTQTEQIVAETRERTQYITEDLKRQQAQTEQIVAETRERTQYITEDLKRQQAQTEQIVAEIREASAEQGVSQQAVYFKKESERHDTLAAEWRFRTFLLALGLVSYAVLSLFMHKIIPGLDPKDAIESAQLIAGKILIFSVIAYMLLLSARNFLANQHNAIINKHRQNALVTLRALVDAAKDEDNSDIVLMQAASCIFTPQETGYTRTGAGGGKQGMTTPVIELLRKASSKVDGS